MASGSSVVVSQMAANQILYVLIKERVQNGLSGTFQGISEMTGKLGGNEALETRVALLDMVRRAFDEILENQRRRVREPN
jgi:hypothetical protein